jgi:restriction system protein
MARKQKTSPIEDLTILVAMLPWWAGIALALGSYLLLHRIAEQPVNTAVPPGQIGTMLTQTLWQTLASFGQYLVPLICLVGAGISAWKRRERQALVAKVSDSSSAVVLDGMSWQQFERLVGEAFRLQGYTVAETGGGGADGGVDLILSKDGEKFLVQCKQWKAFKVGVSVVRELYGVMAAKGAAGGFVVTSGRFTDEASAFASGRNVSLIDGPKLKALIAGARGEAAPRRLEPQVPTQADPEQTAKATEPDCPLCAKPMVKRMAKRGTNAGAEFWGCTAYPACRGTRPIS